MPVDPLFIKRVVAGQAVSVRKEVRGGDNAPRKDVTPAFRATLLHQLETVESEFRNAPPQSQFVPMRVLLEDNSTAKSHRPHGLFTPDIAPIIGAAAQGELFVQLASWGVGALKERIATWQTKAALKAISTIKEIQRVTPTYRLGHHSPGDLLAHAPKTADQTRSRMLARLFRYFEDEDEANKNEAFEKILREHRLPFQASKLPGIEDAYVLDCASVEDVQLVADQVMVRSVQYLPTYLPITTQAFNRSALPANLNNALPPSADCPIVAVVDTGIDASIPQLAPWIVGRETYVATAYLHPDHGSFVAGLIVWGDKLNSDCPHLESLPCRVLDIQMLPNKEDASGNRARLTSEEFFEALEECLRRYAGEVKVWNLSLSSNAPCSLARFSEDAVALDELQQKYGVSIVVAAGNYQNCPLPLYPRTDTEKAAARITAPADTVLGITVGSVAHVEHPQGVKFAYPSPFSRNGPGPNFVIKPDLVQVGGNLSTAGQRPLGVTSVDVGGARADDLGTSFATPLVSRQLAYIYHGISPTPSPVTARAILTHSARDLRSGRRVPDGDDHYLGFGTPVNTLHALRCEPWMMTLVFEEDLVNGVQLQWDNFPYPDSLIEDGRFRGEISMTLAYQPKRGPDWGAEYCETHVDAHFGVIVDGEKGEEFKSKVPLEHRNPGQLYENFQVAKLRKWAPVRTYYHRFPKGVEGKRWKLWVDMISRHGVRLDGNDRQPFTLVLTIADPLRRAPVYDEMSVRLRATLQTQNLALRTQIINRL